MGVAGIAAAVGVVGTAVSIAETINERRDREKAENRAERIRDVQAQRKRVQALRRNRIQQAEIFAQAAASGQTGSSNVQGASASLDTQTASSVGFANRVSELDQQRVEAVQSAERRGQNANLAGGVAGFAFDQGGGFGALRKGFTGLVG